MLRSRQHLEEKALVHYRVAKRAATFAGSRAKAGVGFGNFGIVVPLYRGGHHLL